MALNEELLKILVCPKCKGEINLNERRDGLICNACSLLYPIIDEIPVMLIEEAKPIVVEKHE
ncbi:Trm112 family protein [Desulfatirhabdium butyrativorans]|uniref:Trm112 family protein n=1 Tax=Desulfatirhabdium butyrativorans TaxID=340467 RepID=UPI0003FC2473|nr:Trm112 family protein [Desulfatirhabdium butyrativorans]